MEIEFMKTAFQIIGTKKLFTSTEKSEKWRNMAFASRWFSWCETRLDEVMTEDAHERSVFTLVSAWVILSVNILFLNYPGSHAAPFRASWKNKLRVFFGTID